jgi:putative ABC transport system permease protein
VIDWFFLVRMTRRELRAGRAQTVLYAGAISLGVAALVAIASFRSDVTAALHRESRALLGADVEMWSRNPYGDDVRSILDSVRATGGDVAYVTSFASMAYAPRTGGTRLVEVRAGDAGFPFYGTITTDPPDRWDRLAEAPRVLVEPSVLVYLDADIGDTVRLGDAAFVIDGRVVQAPGQMGIRATIGPRVYIAAAYLDETNLLRFGSLARYSAMVRVADAEQAERFVRLNGPTLDAARVGYATASEREQDLRNWFETMTRFLGLLGLTALLLGGLATGSAIHVFVRRKLTTVAILRCIGARQQTVFGIYLLQATLMGVAGSLLGAVAGLGVQRALPLVLADFLPLAITPTVHLGPILSGLGIGTWIAIVFALLPLLEVRSVAPLQALRHGVDPPRRRLDWPSLGVHGLIIATVVGLSLSQAPRYEAGLAFAGAAVLTTIALWATARLLRASTRRFFPHRAPYVLRQGLANLYRPQNQTMPVTLAVGFGVFLLGTLHLVQRNILDQLAYDAGADRPNVVVFDIQPDQVAGVRDILAAASTAPLATTPIVPARLAQINGRTIAEIVADTVHPVPGRWALRREYRHTYRDSLADSEELLEGAWWDEAPDVMVPRISIEEELAADLHVGLGDHITWDVQGVLLETEITSIRRVDWARFELNFFVVFEPGVLDAAPTTFVTLARVPPGTPVALAQRDLVRSYPNIATLDVSAIQATLERLLRSVSVAIQFMALFSMACGIVVLFGAVATTRLQRLRESVLLKTLGARVPQIRVILAVEYIALGALASASGTFLAVLGGWAAVTFLFELPFRLPVVAVGGWIALGTVATAAVGLIGNRGLAHRPPLAILRAIAE